MSVDIVSKRDLKEVEAALKRDIKEVESAVMLRPVTRNNRKHYTLAELMEDVTPELINELNTEMAWSLDIEPVGRELF